MGKMGFQVKAVVKQISGTTSEAAARNHISLIDRPEGKGGTNRGPMGGELMLMGIGGCFMSNLLANVKSEQLDISDLSLSVSATLEDSPARFSKIVLTLTSACPDKGVLQQLLTIAEAGCIALNTVKTSTVVTATLA
jgi:putative redox protein